MYKPPVYTIEAYQGKLTRNALNWLLLAQGSIHLKVSPHSLVIVPGRHEIPWNFAYCYLFIIFGVSNIFSCSS